MTIGLVIEKVLIPCQVCGMKFWFEYKNEIQECLHCGQRNYRKAILKTTKRREAGRKGGQRTVELYGRENMRELGRRGGLARRLPTLAEVRQRVSPEVQNKYKGGKAPNGGLPFKATAPCSCLPNNLRELREILKLRIKQGELGSLETAPSPPGRRID